GGCHRAEGNPPAGDPRATHAGEQGGYDAPQEARQHTSLKWAAGCMPTTLFSTVLLSHWYYTTRLGTPARASHRISGLLKSADKQSGTWVPAPDFTSGPSWPAEWCASRTPWRGGTAAIRSSTCVCWQWRCPLPLSRCFCRAPPEPSR